ncbi:MAG: hypothetical protein ACLPN1_12400 [Dissulfurispiraceae bacterium]
MKAVVRSSIINAVALIGIVSIGASAQASLSGDQEFLGAFQPSITREQNDNEPLQYDSWAKEKQDDSYEERSDYITVLRALRGDHWIGGYEDAHNNKWQWDTKEPWQNRHSAKADPDPYSTPIPPTALLLGSGLSIFGAMSLIGRKSEDSKGKQQGVSC